jgi:hypothetical protein
LRTRSGNDPRETVDEKAALDPDVADIAPSDVAAGIAERHQGAAIGQRNRIVEVALPSFARRQWRLPFLFSCKARVRATCTNLTGSRSLPAGAMNPAGDFVYGGIEPMRFRRSP